MTDISVSVTRREVTAVAGSTVLAPVTRTRIISGGIAGAQGPQGDTGPQGDQGPTGPPGTNASALGWFIVTDYGAHGNGTDDDTAHVQSALDAATSGGVVFFPAGTYSCSTLTVAHPVVLVGQGAGSTTLKLRTNGNLLAVTASNVTVRDLTLDGDYTTRTSGDLVHAGGTTTPITDVRVTDCLLTKAPGVAVSLTRVERAWVTRCRVLTTGLAGVRLENPGSGNANRDVWVTDNLLVDCNQTATSGHAAVQSHGTASVTQDRVYVLGNTILNPGTCGVGLDLVTHGEVAHNTIQGNGTTDDEGIAFAGSYNHVHHNRTWDNGHDGGLGILLWSSSYAGNAHNVISDNQVWDSGNGIGYVWGADSLTISDLRITGNRVWASGSGIDTSSGVLAYTAGGVTTYTHDGVVVAGNDVRGVTGTGIDLPDDSSGASPAKYDNWVSGTADDWRAGTQDAPTSGYWAVDGAADEVSPSTVMGLHARHRNSGSNTTASAIRIVGGFSSNTAEKIGGLEISKGEEYANTVQTFLVTQTRDGGVVAAGGAFTGSTTSFGSASSAWDGSHLRCGDWHIWVDASGNLRMKASGPTGDTDGTIVGTQS